MRLQFAVQQRVPHRVDHFDKRRKQYLMSESRKSHLINGLTRVRRPQSNGFVEPRHRTLIDEHFRVMGCKKFYDGIEAMQTDLDAYLVSYNTERPHQGRSMKGRTSTDVFVHCLPKPRSSKEEKMKKAA